MLFRACLVVFLAILVPAPLLADSITYPELVQRLTDLSVLAKLPPPGEKTALASSYDRKSVYDAATDAYIAWDANADGHGFVRKEDGKTVMADIDGPGLHLAHLVGHGATGAREDLSRWQRYAGG